MEDEVLRNFVAGVGIRDFTFAYFVPAFGSHRSRSSLILFRGLKDCITGCTHGDFRMAFVAFGVRVRVRIRVMEMVGIG